MDADLTALAIEAACRRLVLRAVECVDDNRPDALAQVFAADAVLSRPSGDALVGVDAIVESYRKRPAGRLTRHLVTNTRVEVDSETSARARSHVLLWSGSDAEPLTAQGRAAPGRQTVGEFDDHFCLTQAGWRIDRREARFVFYKE